MLANVVIIQHGMHLGLVEKAVVGQLISE